MPTPVTKTSVVNEIITLNSNEMAIRQGALDFFATFVAEPIQESLEFEVSRETPKTIDNADGLPPVDVPLGNEYRLVIVLHTDGTLYARKFKKTGDTWIVDRPLEEMLMVDIYKIVKACEAALTSFLTRLQKKNLEYAPILAIVNALNAVVTP